MGIVLVWSLGYWFMPVIGARHWFQGPPTATEVAAYQKHLVEDHDRDDLPVNSKTDARQ